MVMCGAACFCFFLPALWTDRTSLSRGDVTIRYLNLSSNAVSSASGRHTLNVSYSKCQYLCETEQHMFMVYLRGGAIVASNAVRSAAGCRKLHSRTSADSFLTGRIRQCVFAKAGA